MNTATGCFHTGREQTRHYTLEYLRIPAKSFKGLIDSPPGTYSINSKQLSEKFNSDHCKFELIAPKEYPRAILFTIHGKEIPVPLSTDNRSASNKVYLVCPYCMHQRQHLYAVKYDYACKKCLGLEYRSQSEAQSCRLRRRIIKERLALWGADHPDVYSLFEHSCYWPKPKWIRYSTFTRKQNALRELERRYWVIERKVIDRIMSKPVACV
ncbi:MAG: hypothetical protein HRT35_19915 [Algicola sp.]|nr:hypothetical protein [Algicola sp.]